MRVVGLDLETTGLELEKGHRICEAALLTYEDGRLIETFEQRINPERPIDPGASNVHGIMFEDVAECPKFSEVAQQIIDRLKAADVVVIHNASFDAPFIGTELMQAGFELPQMNIFCTLENGRWATPNGKAPKLGELCFALNVPYDEERAHSAAYDVSVMMSCFYKGVERGFFNPKGAQ
jgi:DNA polymerase-3 subunit epsilon